MGGPEQGYGGIARNPDEVQVFRQRVRRPFNEVVAHLGTLGSRNALYSTQIRDLLLMHMENAPDKGQERQLDFAAALAGRSPQPLNSSADAKSNVLMRAVNQLNRVYVSWKRQYHECVETRFQGRSHAAEDVHRSIRISFGIDRPEQMVSSMLLTATASAAWERAMAVVFTEDPNIKDFGLEEFTTDLTAVRWASGGSSVQAQARQWWDAYWRQFRLRSRWNDELQLPLIIALLLRRMSDWGLVEGDDPNGRVNVSYAVDHVWAAMSQWADLIVNRVGSSVGGLPRRTRIVRDWLLNYAVIDMVVDRERRAAVFGKSPADAVLDGKLYCQLLGTVRKDYERFMARRGEMIPAEDRADVNAMLRPYRMRYAMASGGDEDDEEVSSAMATPSVVPGLTDRVLDNAIVQLTNRCGRDGRMLVDERIKAVRLLQEVRSFAMVTAHGEETYHANIMRVFELEEANRVPLGQDLLNGLSNGIGDDDRVWEDTLSDTQGGDGSIPDPLSRYHDDDSLVAATILEYFRKESQSSNKHQLFPLYRGDAISPASVFVYESVAKAQIHEYGMVAREYPVPHDKLTTIATDAVQETERIARRVESDNSVDVDDDNRHRYDSMRDLTYGKGSNPKKPDSIARQVKRLAQRMLDYDASIRYVLGHLGSGRELPTGDALFIGMSEPPVVRLRCAVCDLDRADDTVQECLALLLMLLDMTVPGGSVRCLRFDKPCRAAKEMGGAEVSLRDRLGRESDRMVKGTMPKSERSQAADDGGSVGSGSKENSFKGNTVLVEDITWWDVLTIDEQRIDGLCDELRQKAQNKLDHDYDLHIRMALDQDSYLWRQRAERHAKHRYAYDCEQLREQTQSRKELLASRVKEFGDKRSKLRALFESVAKLMGESEPVRMGIGTGGSDASQGDTRGDMNRAVVRYAEDVVSRYLQRCAFGMDADVPLTLAERSRRRSRR